MLKKTWTALVNSLTTLIRYDGGLMRMLHDEMVNNQARMDSKANRGKDKVNNRVGSKEISNNQVNNKAANNSKVGSNRVVNNKVVNNKVVNNKVSNKVGARQTVDNHLVIDNAWRPTHRDKWAAIAGAIIANSRLRFVNA